MKTSLSVFIRIILWIILLAGGAWVSIVNDLKEQQTLFFNPWFHLISFIIGAILMKFAFHAAAVGGKELAKNGREGNIVRLETNKLVTTGIYKCTRHPMLFGLMLIPLALALILGSVSFIVFVAPLEMLFILFMVLIFEEMECKQKFGSAYEDYKKETPLFPKTVACLKELFIS